MSDQHWASGNFDLLTAGVCSTNLYDTLGHAIKRTAPIAATSARSVQLYPYFTQYYYYYNIYIIIRIISKLEIEIWVRIHCRKWPTGTPTTGDQWVNKTMNSKDSVIKHQRLLANGVSSINRSIRICLTDVCHPASAYHRLEFSTQCINGLGKGCAFVQPDVICNTEFDMHLKLV